LRKLWEQLYENEYYSHYQYLADLSLLTRVSQLCKNFRRMTRQRGGFVFGFGA
jgi:hypothetical protein